jgi:hypothetical protein|tara:strand:+ start:722 stop:1006 length:285 start_codon:yes stop_codon:yes gene_type:complete
VRLFLVIFAITLHTSFLHAKDPSFKLTFGGSLGNIPLEINKVSKNIKTLTGFKINSWILSPNFSSFIRDKKKINLSENKDFKKDSLFIKLNFKF